MTAAQAFAARFDVSRETMERLQQYHRLLLKWNSHINLVSSSTLGDAWTRHFHDSAQAFELCPDGAKSWIDIGSGGGFPGAVVAILATGQRPDLRVTLIESDQRKAVFLRTVARETGTDMDVVAGRIEDASHSDADVLSARALAPLSDLLLFAKNLMKDDGRALFFKGRSWRNELRLALETWTFDCETYPSETDEDSVILKIGGIERA